MQQLLTDTSQSLILVVGRFLASRDGDDTGYFAMFYVSEQSVLLNVPDEFGDNIVASARQGLVLNEKPSAADSGDYAFKEEERLSGERRLTEHMRDEDHIPAGDKGAARSGPQLHKSLFGGACPVSPVVIDVCAHCAAMEAVHEVQRYRKFAVNSCRRH